MSGRPVPFRCPGCRRVLGVGWPDRLEVGPAAFRKHVTVECLGCGVPARWYPAKPPPPAATPAASASAGVSATERPAAPPPPGPVNRP